LKEYYKKGDIVVDTHSKSSRWFPRMTALFAAVIAVLYLVPRDALDGVTAALANIVRDIVTDERLNGFGIDSQWLVLAALPFVGAMILAAVMMYSAYVLLPSQPRVKRNLFVCASVAVFVGLCEAAQCIVSSRVPRMFDWAMAFAGVFMLLLAVLVYPPLNRKLPKLVNYEVISYIVCGVITSVINIVIFDLMFRQLSPDTVLGENPAIIISNSVSWVAAVSFAYVSNRLFVFRSTFESVGKVIREVALFFGARLVSFGVDMAAVLLLINVMQVNSTIAKILSSVLVLIINYIFSKVFIFKKDKERTGDEF